jgi:hypothetical protein
MKSGVWIVAGLALALSVVGLVPIHAARAQPMPDAAKEPPAPEGLTDIERARALAKQASRALHMEQRYIKALELATQAEGLHHAPFHLAVIGESLMGMGRLTEAMATFERLVAEPLPAGAPEAAVAAQEDGRRRLIELSALVPSLLLVVKGPPKNAVGATVDGKPLSVGGTSATRFDPGPHAIHAAAPGYAPFNRTVTLPTKGGAVVVEAVLQAEAPPPGDDKRPLRVPGIVLLASGGVGFFAGAVTGGVFLSRLAALKARCPENRCASADQAEARSVGTLGDVSTAALIVGGAGVVTGGIMLVVQRAGTKRRRTGASAEAIAGERRLELGLAPGGVTLGGRF